MWCKQYLQWQNIKICQCTEYPSVYHLQGFSPPVHCKNNSKYKQSSSCLNKGLNSFEKELMDSLLDLTYPMIYLILVCLNHSRHLFSSLHIFASFSLRTFEVLYPVSFKFPENPVTPIFKHGYSIWYCLYSVHCSTWLYGIGNSSIVVTYPAKQLHQSWLWDSRLHPISAKRPPYYMCSQ